jgi:hypothetical protein
VTTSKPQPDEVTVGPVVIPTIYLRLLGVLVTLGVLALLLGLIR